MEPMMLMTLDTLAYIGPGAGLGAFVVAIALGLGVVLLVAGLVWYPLKRLIRGTPGDVDGGPTDAAG
jgi:hypothetical protein